MGVPVRFAPANPLREGCRRLRGRRNRSTAAWTSAPPRHERPHPAIPPVTCLCSVDPWSADLPVCAVKEWFKYSVSPATPGRRHARSRRPGGPRSDLVAACFPPSAAARRNSRSSAPDCCALVGALSFRCVDAGGRQDAALYGSQDGCRYPAAAGLASLNSAARNRLASPWRSFHPMAPFRSTSGRNSQKVSP